MIVQLARDMLAFLLLRTQEIPRQQIQSLPLQFQRVCGHAHGGIVLKQFGVSPFFSAVSLLQLGGHGHTDLAHGVGHFLNIKRWYLFGGWCGRCFGRWGRGRRALQPC